jgi:hypothetical protein
MIDATVCEQCDGTGWVKGHRCPCREEDDTAEERRRQMKQQNRRELGKPPHGQIRTRSEPD